MQGIKLIKVSNQGKGMGKGLTMLKSFLQENKEQLPEEGVLGKDKPLRILYGRSNKDNNTELLLLIQWKARNDGIIPKPSFYTNTQIKQVDKMLLVEYYESCLKFPQLEVKNE